MDELTITRPDDWHLHLRDGDHMRAVVGDTARRFARAIVMPNLRPPVTTTELALAYRQRILAALPAGSAFQPLMTLYLTDNTRPVEIAKARASGAVHAVKYYPAGATTNSESGVTDVRRCDDTLQAMADTGMPLLVHGEVTDPAVDVFDRERVFIERVLMPLVERFPRMNTRLAARAELDGLVQAWVGARDAAEALATLDAAEVPCCLVNSVRDLFADNIGRTLTRDQIREAFDDSFGRNAGQRVRIACDDDGKRRIISEITIGLWGTPGDAPDFGKLIRAARPTDGGCIGGIVDAVGLQ